MKEIKLKGLDEIIYEHETKEGLKVYIWQNVKIKGNFMTLSVKYGSIHTDFKIGNKTYHLPTGIAHFLEHVKFNKGPNETAHENFYHLSGDPNAFTTFRYTSYLVYASKNIKENLEELLDFVYTPYFTKQLINKEKGIIVEEANMGEDNVDQKLFFNFYGQLFKESKFKNRIVGSVEDIKKITVEDLELVYNVFYHPKNMFLCVTGNSNPYEIAKIVDENLAQKSFPKFKNPKVITPIEDKKVAIKYKEVEENINQTKVKYGLKIPKNKFKNYNDYELRLYLNLILNCNFGNTSSLKEELISKNLITNLFASSEIYDEFVGIMISSETDYDQELIKRIEYKLKHLEVLEKDFLRKKKGLIANLILNFEYISTINNNIQRDIILEGKIINNVKDIYENLNYDNLLDIMNNIKTNNKSILIAKPKKDN